MKTSARTVRRPAPGQMTMLADGPAMPAGLRYRPDFVSRDEERRLIGHILALPLEPFQFGAFEGKRRVMSFGSRYDYTNQSLEQADPLPSWILPISARVEQFAALPSGAVRQILFTAYEAGVGIGWHRDKRHYEHILGLSLASPCKFRFRRKSGTAWERVTLDAAPRSLYLMTGDSRHIWEHSIPPVGATRYSITFRTMAKR